MPIDFDDLLDGEWDYDDDEDWLDDWDASVDENWEDEDDWEDEEADVDVPRRFDPDLDEEYEDVEFD